MNAHWPRRLDAATCPASPWKNGGGLTRELFSDADEAAADAPAPAWSVRLSLADITRDGPFSAFPGVTRWFTVVEGAGVRLGPPGAARALTPHDAPWCFDGALAPDCHLIDGPTRDLNLMLHGLAGGLLPARPQTPWTRAARWRGLFCATPARWSHPQGELHLNAGQGLVMHEDPGTPWTLRPTNAAATPLRAWWWWAGDVVPPTTTPTEETP